MNTQQASRKWEIPEDEVRRICHVMGIDADSIPEDTVPVYVPHEFYRESPHRFYLYLMDVIANTHMEIQGVDKDILETCVAQLKEKKLIILRKGADPDSLDYHDYLISSERALYNDWYISFTKEHVSIIDKVLSIFFPQNRNSSSSKK